MTRTDKKWPTGADPARKPTILNPETATQVGDTAVMAVVLLRCSAGHLFTATRLKLVFLTVHLGYVKLAALSYRSQVADSRTD